MCIFIICTLDDAYHLCDSICDKCKYICVSPPWELVVKFANQVVAP
jgi:hypothetical protein